MARLNRESNPTPGEKPGFMPQHEKSDGSMANTGENNPLPVNGNVQLTGSNVLLNNLTSSIYGWMNWGESTSNTSLFVASNALNVSNFTRRKIVINNNTDASLIKNELHMAILDNSDNIIEEQVINLGDFPAGETVTLDGATTPKINDVFTHMTLITNAVNATTGDVTVSFLGGQSDKTDAMESYGKTINERPNAAFVPVGHVYMAVDTGDTWQSNGTSWVVF